MAKTQSSAHAVYRISYHFVWAPKDRKKALKGEIAERIAELLEWTGNKYEFEIETVSVQIDHLHVLVSAPPCYSPADLARMMKSITAKKIFEEYPGRKRKEFWGGRLWERGYYVGTSGEAVSSDLIKRYIEYRQNQQQLRLLDWEIKTRQWEAARLCPGGGFTEVEDYERYRQQQQSKAGA